MQKKILILSLIIFQLLITNFLIAKVEFQTAKQLKLESIGYPTKEYVLAAQPIQELKIFNNSLYLGFGDATLNTGPTDVIYYDLSSDTFHKEYTVQDEAISQYCIVEGKLAITGVDATEDWSYGNIYVKQDSGWVKHRTIPRGLHVFDLVEQDSLWFAGTGSVFELSGEQIYAFGGIFVSDDKGENWTLSYGTPSDANTVYRIKNLVKFQGSLYAFFYGYQAMLEEVIPQQYRADLGDTYQDQYLIFSSDLMGPLDMIRFEKGAWQYLDVLPENDLISSTPIVFGDKMLLNTHSGKFISAYGKRGRQVNRWYIFNGENSKEVELPFNSVHDWLLAEDALRMLVQKDGRYLIAETRNLEDWTLKNIPDYLKPLSLEFLKGEYFLGAQNGFVYKTTGWEDFMETKINNNVHAFYYPWWGSEEFDGFYFHWKHDQMGAVDERVTYPGGDDIGADFYPELGSYSSNDPEIIIQHMKWLRQAGVGTISVSWWGKDSFEDKAITKLMDIAAEFGIKVNFHLEPMEERNADRTLEWVKYLIDRYGNNPAFYREELTELPLFYVYDSYKTPAEDWARLLKDDGEISLRGTEYDALFIGLWVNKGEEQFMLDGGFDGFYNYFATDNFSYGSTWKNWAHLAEFAQENDLLYIPCVGPGYNDQRIRPWNRVNYRNREDGKYYDTAWQHGLNTKARIIGITSFNEWHEGTQIEPSIPKKIKGFEYEDFKPLTPDWYLKRTRSWVDKLGETK